MADRTPSGADVATEGEIFEKQRSKLYRVAAEDYYATLRI